MGTFRTDVEGLRAVAVLLVLGDHLLGVPHGGFIGVDVFFVVSGFLITGLLVRESGRTGTVALRAFWLRRVRRLLPTALVVLAVTCTVAQLLFLPVRAAQASRDAVFAALSVANWRFAALGTDYFSDTRPPSPVQQYWSLAVEEQFYVLWPVVVLLLATRASAVLRRRLTLAAGVVLATSLAWSVHVSGSAAAYFSTPARAYELAAGALLALHVDRAERLRPRVAGALSVAGLTGIVLSAIVLDPAVPFPGAAALLPVVATVALLAGGAGGADRGVGRLLSSPLPRYLGRISYSLYLWHWPVLVFGLALRPDRPPWLPPVLLAVSLGLAATSYAAVERPLRAAPEPGPGRLPRLALPAVLTAGLLVVTGSVVASALPPTGTGTGGGAAAVQTLPGGASAQRPPADAWPGVPALADAVRAGLDQEEVGRLTPPLEALEAAAAPEWLDDGCLDVFATEEARCVYGPAQAPRTAVLLGDSVAISWLPGLRAALEPRGYRLHVLTRRQCALGAPEDAVSPGCRLHRARVLDSTAALDPDLVVVAGSYVAAARSLREDDRTAWQERLEGSLRGLLRPGRRVAVLSAPPQTGNLQSCATRLGTARDCVRPLGPVWSALGDAERSAARAAGARFVDVTTWFCADRACPATVGGTPVAVDGTHLTAAHSRRLALLLRAALTD